MAKALELVCSPAREELRTHHDLPLPGTIAKVIPQCCGSFFRLNLTCTCYDSFTTTLFLYCALLFGTPLLPTAFPCLVWFSCFSFLFFPLNRRYLGR